MSRENTQPRFHMAFFEFFINVAYIGDSPVFMEVHRKVWEPYKKVLQYQHFENNKQFS